MPSSILHNTGSVQPFEAALHEGLPRGCKSYVWHPIVTGVLRSRALASALSGATVIRVAVEGLPVRGQIRFQTLQRGGQAWHQHVSLRGHMCMQEQSKLEAAVIFLDAVVTQVSAAHLQAGAARQEGILRELESLLQEVREGQVPGGGVVMLVRGLSDSCISYPRSAFSICDLHFICGCCSPHMLLPCGSFHAKDQTRWETGTLQAVGRRCQSFSSCHERNLDWQCIAMVPFKRGSCCRCWLQGLQIQC
jgi:hypothetical protein